MSKINSFKMALVSTGMVGFTINMVQVFYKPFNIDVILLTFLIAVFVTIVIVIQSYNEELWKIGIYILGSFTVTLIVPMSATIIVQDITPMTKFVTYLSWFAFPILSIILGFVFKGDNN